MIFNATQPKILIFEYITGGGLQDSPLPCQLAREGLHMLRALLRDLAELAVTVDLLLDPRMQDALGNATAGINIIHCPARSSLEPFLLQLLSEYDAFWPVAPESGNILLEISRLSEKAGTVLLNSDSQAVAIASSKLATVELLGKAGLPVVPVQHMSRFDGHWPLPWVIKPDCGLDCEKTRKIDFREQLAELPWEEATGMVVQPFISGQPCSLSLVVSDGRAELLCCNLLEVSTDDHGEFKFDATRVNAISLTPELLAIAQATARHLPGLRGYVGIDLLQQGEQVFLLEVNPRLTTSYAGIFAATGINVAAMVINHAMQISWETVANKPGQVVRVVAGGEKVTDE